MSHIATIGGPDVNAPIRLPARLDSAAAAGLARTLADRQGSDVVLDAADVDLFGALALQTLLVAEAAWRTAGHAFYLVNLSPATESQLADLGLADPDLLGGATP